MADAADRAPIPTPPPRSWPFLLRQSELAAARTFLNDRDAAAPRLLRIFGESGSGKSFLAKEIVADLAHNYSQGAILHINVPPADLEASDFLGQVNRVLQSPGAVDQSGGGFVSAALVRRWRTQGRGQSRGRWEYFYNVLRELSGQIPLAGPFIKACLPPKLPAAEGGGSEPAGALRFLLRESHSHPVLIVIDNIQFLPSPVRDILDGELPVAGRRLSMVTIERLRGDRGLFWMPAINGLAKQDIHLGHVTVQDVEVLVREQLPGEAHVAEIAEAIHRRSGGNLKSVWFQTKFVASRRASQGSLLDDASYEAVVQSLTPVDQLVLRVVVVLLGGLSICQMLGIIKAMNLHVAGEAVGTAIADLSALGLLVVNSKHHDRVRVEHEVVSHVVSQLIPEEEKLELQSQLVHALPALLEGGGPGDADALTLYDRLIGIATEQDVRSSPLIQSQIVRFIELSENAESYTYLCTLL
ncbi:MAG: AAA family ATPase, partial [Allosphingosinicella sp.]